MHFVISYHTDQLTGLSKIVAFEAIPASIKSSCAAHASTKGQMISWAAQLSTSPELVASQGADVTFSYSMEYKVTEAKHLPCASLPDVFLKDCGRVAVLKQSNGAIYGTNEILAKIQLDCDFCYAAKPGHLCVSLE